MPFEFKIPGQTKSHIATITEEAGGTALGNTDAAAAEPIAIKSKDQNPESDTVRFDNMDEVEHAFKKGSLDWPNHIEVKGFNYVYNKSYTKGLIEMLKGKQPGYVIYHIPEEYLEKARQSNLGHWMVFLFKTDGPSKIAPHGIMFTTAARGTVIYEDQQVIGDIVLLKIALPSGIIALKAKVDTGAEISSLHVDSHPKIVGDIVKFENHNASGNVISAPLVAKQAVKTADGGVEYRPVIELDIEINGKKISKAQFNLNDRSKMEYEVLVGQNILEKSGFLVNPRQNNVQEDEKTDLMALSEKELDNLIMQMFDYLKENNNKED